MSTLTKEERLIIESRMEMMRPLIEDLAKTKTERDLLKSQLATAREALEEISKGAGPYSQDPFEHCRNTVEAMKNLAKVAIAHLSDAGGKK